MSIFTKSPSQVTTADLQELLSEGAVENVRLEFKSEVPKKDETLKKLSSFANTFGGYMVMGAKADSKDGRLQGVPGVDVQSGYKQTIAQWCFDGASPPLVVEVSDPVASPSANGKICYVLYAPESDVAPHFLNCRNGVWVRTDEFSAHFEAQLATENELRYLLDRRELVRERRTLVLQRARKRFGVYAARVHRDRPGVKENPSPMLEMSVIPRFPARQLCQEEDLQDRIWNSQIPYRHVIYPNPSQQLLSQHESVIVLSPATGTSIF